MFDLHFDKRKKQHRIKKCINATAHVKNILHEDTLYITLKAGCAELAFSIIFDRMVIIFFYEICHFCFIWYVVGLLQYSKSAWSKVGTPTVYMLISCILMLQNCIWSGKSCKMYAIFTMLSSFVVSIQHFEIK